MSNFNFIKTDRIEFHNGGVLDGAILASAFSRIRFTETNVSNLLTHGVNSGTGSSQDYVFHNFDSATNTDLSNAVGMGVILFETQTDAYYPESSFLSFPNGTIFRFVNSSNLDVNIGYVKNTNTFTIVTIVSGEALRILKPRNSNSFISLMGI